jgi:adenine-specific DNA-methyltransferase
VVVNGLRASRKRPSRESWLDQADASRAEASKALDPTRRRTWGQFLTPAPMGRFMATFFRKVPADIYLLDAGAGTGILTASAIERWLSARKRPRSITVTAYEADSTLLPYLDENLRLCAEQCMHCGVNFTGHVCAEDFMGHAVDILRGDFFSPSKPRFNAALVNPPYAKIAGTSRTRRLLRSGGIETSNLYTAFLLLIARLLEPGGELVAITPRSFCNGPYFRAFRTEFLDLMTLRRIHVFDARDKAFSDDEVLQENLITYAVKAASASSPVILSSSRGTDDRGARRRCRLEEVVSPKDPERVIHLATDERQAKVRVQMENFPARLADLSLTVSTGRVVDFRARAALRRMPGYNTVPLIYPCHFHRGFVAWPRADGRKPNALERNPATEPLLVPAGVYVLVKRFTSKEERRRLVACIYDPERVPAEVVGFENHLDYFHMHGRGLPMALAKGLATFLNSTHADMYFRQFNGHTQVNASDLRRLAYPERETLERLGRRVGPSLPDQAGVDELVEKELLS